MTLSVTPVGFEHPDLHELIRRLDRDLLDRYPAEHIFGIDFTDPAVKNVHFAVAYLGGEPVGCGAIRPLTGRAAELKRFFVDPAFRRRGIASSLLAHLERHAAREGFAAIRLETGARQPESIALYEKFGYRQIPCFGEYADCEASVCYEKKLPAGPTA